MTDATSATKTDILYNRGVTIENGLATTDTVNAAGIQGFWECGGWYADASRKGKSIARININKNETVYGKWEFEPLEETTTEETTIPTTGAFWKYYYICDIDTVNGNWSRDLSKTKENNA